MSTGSLSRGTNPPSTALPPDAVPALFSLLTSLTVLAAPVIPCMTKWYDEMLPMERSHAPSDPARLHADRATGRHCHHCGPGGHAVAGGPEGPRVGTPL